MIFPIRDGNGKMTGFGARILNPDDVPKFLNSPQTPLFDKGRLLYGLDQARKPIRTQDQVVIVEGYLDVIVLHQAGFTNTVSPMGTALTEDQVRMLKRFTRRSSWPWTPMRPAKKPPCAAWMWPARRWTTATKWPSTRAVCCATRRACRPTCA